VSSDHVKRVCEAPGIGDDMDKLCEYLWGNADYVARGKQTGECISRGRMLRVLHYFRGDEKACVKPVES
jgi:hypothetical protein